MKKKNKRWKIWVDTGGTFTDCVAHDPQGRIHRTKVLSSSALRGKITDKRGDILYVKERWNVGHDIFRGYTLKILASDHPHVTVSQYNPQLGLIQISPLLQGGEVCGHDFEITAYEEAPIFASRVITLNGLYENLPPIDMRLGSTKGTNALFFCVRGERTN
ncbi:MAG: hydantoinase/oxoprolinase N-terminal domain-containing protein [bacterium]